MAPDSLLNPYRLGLSQGPGTPGSTAVASLSAGHYRSNLFREPGRFFYGLALALRWLTEASQLEAAAPAASPEATSARPPRESGHAGAGCLGFVAEVRWAVCAPRQAMRTMHMGAL